MSLTQIADDEEKRRNYVKYWGDLFLESRSALGLMRDLLIQRRDEIDRRIVNVKNDIRMQEMLAASPEGETPE